MFPLPPGSSEREDAAGSAGTRAGRLLSPARLRVPGREVGWWLGPPALLESHFKDNSDSRILTLLSHGGVASWKRSRTQRSSSDSSMSAITRCLCPRRMARVGHEDVTGLSAFWPSEVCQTFPEMGFPADARGAIEILSPVPRRRAGWRSGRLRCRPHGAGAG